MPTTLNQTPNVQECEAALVSHGFKISPRDPKVKPEFTGAFMVTDPEDDEDGYAIVGDDRNELVVEAFNHLLT